MVQKATAPFSTAYINLFNSLWKDNTKMQVVTDEVIESITVACVRSAGLCPASFKLTTDWKTSGSSIIDANFIINTDLHNGLLTLNRTNCHSTNKVFLKAQKYYKYWNYSKHRTCYKQIIIVTVWCK